MFISLLAKRNEPKKVQPFTWPAIAGCPALLAKNGRHRKVANAPPSRLTVLYCAARRREMASKHFLQRAKQKTYLGVNVKTRRDVFWTTDRNAQKTQIDSALSELSCKYLLINNGRCNNQ